MDDLVTGAVPDDALPPVVSAQEWEKAHAELLIEEKALTRARDALAAKRRRMPMTAVTKDYRFVGPGGEVGLAELFAGRAQLILYRFYARPLTVMDELGLPARLIADQLGHARVSMTQNVYLGRRTVGREAAAALDHAYRQTQRPTGPSPG